jgi:hemerythrin-like domain-containing protein
MIQIGTPPATIDTPIEHLMACHRRIEQRLETLILAAGHIRNNQAAAMDAIRNALEFLDTSGALHTEDEEISLFPRLREKLSIPELAFVHSLEEQHIQAGTNYAELKELALALDRSAGHSAESIGAYLDCATRLRALYRDHIRAEDEVLTALARRSLSELEISEISSEMSVRRKTPKVR